jgi:segregation and condensation protein A
MLNDPVAVGPGRPGEAAEADSPLERIEAAAAGRAPGGPRVVIGEERRPETATRISLAEFEGPLGLLLAVIEARQLDVLTVPLGALAEAYLEALADLEIDRLGNISAFVAVASQLILIKSRALLPRHRAGAAEPLADDGADPEAELRERLILYRAYRDAGQRLVMVAQERIGVFRREPTAALAAALAGARPPDREPLDPGLLPEALAGIIRIMALPEPPRGVVPRTITLAERAAVIRAALASADAIVLQELLRGTRDRVVVAVTFLALLELVKRREVTVEQSEPWGPIVARRTAPGDDPAARPDADEPFDESLSSYA